MKFEVTLKKTVYAKVLVEANKETDVEELISCCDYEKVIDFGFAVPQDDWEMEGIKKVDDGEDD